MKPAAKQQKHSTDRINILNIGLMVVSAILAYVWPFYLFLVAYAVLGPLHYLTEISWLHDRSYYTNRKYDYLFLLIAGVVYGGSLLVKYSEPQILANAIPLAFFGSIIFISTKNWYARAALMVAAVGLAYAVPINFTTVVLGMLLLTMVHVFLFTGLFILFGAMISSSRTGYLSLAIFIAMALVLLFARSLPGNGVADAFVIQHYDTAFGDLNI
ncbi:MAG TPA: hypothetical protein VG537_02345, partial [Candidatus Kapabacteria bacterium]|nr:hypothetical protein [Candidatus Kapabacteria bacterium]